MKQIENKVAFVTGAASGVGYGMAQAFLEAGMKVIAADIRPDALAAAGDRLQADETRLRTMIVDVSDEAAMIDAADKAAAMFGKVHVVCNNAGVNLFNPTPIEEADQRDWEWLLGVNLFGVVHGVKAFAPILKAQGEGGHIVNTGSMSSFITGPGAGIYSAAKFAVHGYTNVLRYSMAEHGVGVSLLCPGLVDSDIYKSHLVRPSDLDTASNSVAPETVERIAVVQRNGMAPIEVGRKVLAGIRANAHFILPHPEFREELQEIFEEIVASLPDEQPPEERFAFEEMRRAAKRQAQLKVDALG